MSFPLLDTWLAASGDEDAQHGVPRTSIRVVRKEDVSPDHPDYSIVVAIRVGDRSVFDTLVRQHAQELLRFGCAILVSQAEAEEAVQDVFLWLWRNRTEWTPRSGVRPYLLRAVA